MALTRAQARTALRRLAPSGGTYLLLSAQKLFTGQRKGSSCSGGTLLGASPIWPINSHFELPWSSIGCAWGANEQPKRRFVFSSKKHSHFLELRRVSIFWEPQFLIGKWRSHLPIEFWGSEMFLFSGYYSIAFNKKKISFYLASMSGFNKLN